MSSIDRFISESGKKLDSRILDVCYRKFSEETIQNACELACAYLRAGKDPGRALADALEDLNALD